MVLIPLKRVLKRVQEFLPLTGVNNYSGFINFALLKSVPSQSTIEIYSVVYQQPF